MSERRGDAEMRRCGDAATRRRGDPGERAASHGDNVRDASPDDNPRDAVSLDVANGSNRDSRAAVATGAVDAASRQRSLKPVDIVVIAYLTIIAALMLIFRHRIQWWPHFIAAHALAIALIVLLAKWARDASRRVAASPHARVDRQFQLSHFLRGWYLVPLIPMTYKELSYLIPLLHPRDFDVELAALDYRLFGAHPTVWMERLTWPPLTEILQLAYATYYFLPIALGVVLWHKRRFAEFDFWIYIIAFGFYLSYLGYIAVPATGPRFLPLIKDAQTAPLAGVWIFQTLRETLDKAEGITRDCFPSGHTELTLLVLYYARRFHRRTFWVMLPIGSALIFSTVYLRYHYVIDVMAGALLAIFIIVIANLLYRALGGEGSRGVGE